MTGPMLPPAWESAPDILSTNSSPQRQRRRPHSHSSPLPCRTGRQRGRGISRHDAPQEERTLEWADRGRAVRALQPFTNSENAPDPPYPVTPPLERPEPALPPLGFRAPTPLPEAIVPPSSSLPGHKPRSLLHIQRRGLRKLDNSLKKLSIASLVTGVMLLVSSILFVRSLEEGTPRNPAGRTALVFFFCTSIVAFVASFTLVLGVLCRRSRGKPSSRIEPGRREEMELSEMRLRNDPSRLPMHNPIRRNAFSGASGEPNPESGLWPSTRRLEREGVQAIHHPNAAAVRAGSQQLLDVQPSQAAFRQEKQAWPSSLVSSESVAQSQLHRPRTPSATCPEAIGTTTQTHGDGDNISPRTIPEVFYYTARGSTFSGRSSKMFNQHMLTTGTRELQAYLDASSETSSDTLAAKRTSSSSSDSGLENDDDCSEYSDRVGSLNDDEESQIHTASVLSFRNVGKARQCRITAPQGSVSGPRNNSKTAQQSLKDITVNNENSTLDYAHADEFCIEPVSRGERRWKRNPSAVNLSHEWHQPANSRRAILDPFPSAPLLPLANRNRENCLIQAHRSRSLSPKKSSMPAASKRPIGLGIHVPDEPDKENTEPVQVLRRRSEESELDGWAPVEPFESA